jgi:glutathione-regulated potassium-efflux system ancillary protein KefC
MSEHGLMFDVVILLAAGIIFVPISQRLGLGSVIGYLAAGLVIGPPILGWVTATESMAHVSEFGVVFLLFIIGLELEPKRLWQWRVPIFLMGSAQVAGVASLIACLARLFGIPWPSAFVLGTAGAMSSTAIASQILRDRNLMNTGGGSSAFSILLFQDLAVIPVLAALPLLAGQEGSAGGAAPVWQIFLVIAGVILAGRYLLRHVLRLVAGTHLREVFTAMSLLIVVGLAFLMQYLGVSMALGAFMGGVLLATSEYRHAIETDLEPFKGLLLGLFFISVGMSVNVGTVMNHPHIILGLALGLILLKFGAHYWLGRAFKLSRREIPLFSILISQVGEFAFVLLGAAQALGLISSEINAVFSVAVAFSMAMTPLMVKAYDRWWAMRLCGNAGPDMSRETVQNDDPEVLIAGFGRVGQIVGRLLYANRIRATVLDHDPEQIELLRQFGFKIYYGDATRLDLLEAAGARTAKILVVAVDDQEDSLEIVDLAQEHFPHLKLVVRARNVAHVYELIDRDIHTWERETFDSSLRMGTDVLKVLGWESYSAVKAAARFRDHNIQLIYNQHSVRGDRAKLVSAVKQAREDLEKMFAGEDEQRKRHHDGWDIHPEGR